MYRLPAIFSVIILTIIVFFNTVQDKLFWILFFVVFITTIVYQIFWGNKREKKQIEVDRLNRINEEKERIKLEILEKERKKQLRRDIKKELIKEGVIHRGMNISESSREKIQTDVADSVWNRDRGRCVYCGSNERLEFDHIIPISKGGANTYRNLQLLCENCNREKSNKIG